MCTKESYVLNSRRPVVLQRCAGQGGATQILHHTPLSLTSNHLTIIKKSAYLDVVQQGTLAILDLAVVCASVMASTCH